MYSYVIQESIVINTFIQAIIYVMYYLTPLNDLSYD
jgi:hypothetical protein